MQSSYTGPSPSCAVSPTITNETGQEHQGMDRRGAFRRRRGAVHLLVPGVAAVRGHHRGGPARGTRAEPPHGPAGYLCRAGARAGSRPVDDPGGASPRHGGLPLLPGYAPVLEPRLPDRERQHQPARLRTFPGGSPRGRGIPAAAGGRLRRFRVHGHALVPAEVVRRRRRARDRRRGGDGRPADGRGFPGEPAAAPVPPVFHPSADHRRRNRRDGAGTAAVQGPVRDADDEPGRLPAALAGALPGPGRLPPVPVGGAFQEPLPLRVGRHPGGHGGTVFLGEIRPEPGTDLLADALCRRRGAVLAGRGHPDQHRHPDDRGLRLYGPRRHPGLDGLAAQAPHRRVERRGRRAGHPGLFAGGAAQHRAQFRLLAGNLQTRAALAFLHRGVPVFHHDAAQRAAPAAAGGSARVGKDRASLRLLLADGARDLFHPGGGVPGRDGRRAGLPQGAGPPGAACEPAFLRPGHHDGAAPAGHRDADRRRHDPVGAVAFPGHGTVHPEPDLGLLLRRRRPGIPGVRAGIQPVQQYAQCGRGVQRRHRRRRADLRQFPFPVRPQRERPALLRGRVLLPGRRGRGVAPAGAPGAAGNPRRPGLCRHFRHHLAGAGGPAFRLFLRPLFRA